MNNLNFLYTKEKFYRATREFFYKKNFHEIIPHLLSKDIPTEPSIHPFKTYWELPNNKIEFCLPASPERYMKKIISEGIGNCFSIGYCFRNLEGSGPFHNPEFMMLEWYRVNEDYKSIIKDLKEYVLYVSNIVNDKITYPNNWPILSLENLFEKYTGLNYQKSITDEKYFFGQLKLKNYNTDNSSWLDMFSQVLVNEVENNFTDEPFFLVDFPARQSPLCAVNKDKPYLADRFEFYFKKIEMANGNNENLDFENMKKVNSDTEFLTYIKKMQESGNTYSGVGFGLDRLLMVLAENTEIEKI